MLCRNSKKKLILYSLQYVQMTAVVNLQPNPPSGQISSSSSSSSLLKRMKSIDLLFDIHAAPVDSLLALSWTSISWDISGISHRGSYIHTRGSHEASFQLWPVSMRQLQSRKGRAGGGNEGALGSADILGDNIDLLRLVDLVRIQGRAFRSGFCGFIFYRGARRPSVGGRELGALLKLVAGTALTLVAFCESDCGHGHHLVQDGEFEFEFDGIDHGFD